MLIKQIYQKNKSFVTIGVFKILVLSMRRFFAMVAKIWCKKLWVLIILLLHILREMLTDFIFGIWAKMMQLTYLMVLTWLIKGVFYKFFSLYIKMSEGANLTYYQRIPNVKLNRAKGYHENDKKKD